MYKGKSKRNLCYGIPTNTMTCNKIKFDSNKSDPNFNIYLPDDDDEPIQNSHSLHPQDTSNTQFKSDPKFNIYLPDDNDDI